jgi:lysophospholipase L1-like esterase
LAYANYFVDATGLETTLGNAYTLEAAIEIPSAPVTSCVRVTFSGSNTGTVPDGAALFLSDSIPASSFGLATIPAGTTIYIHDSVLVTSGQLIPVPSAYTPSAGEASVQNNNASSQVMTTGIPTGTEVNLQSPLIGVLGKFTSPEVSIAIMGDSIADFSLDANSSGINGTSGGIMVRSMWGVNGRNIPWVNLARSSSNMATASANMARRLKMLAYATHLVSEGGTNDLAAGTTPAVTQTALQAIWGVAKQLGISRVAQMKILARTDSTNATPIANFGIGQNRDTLNTALIANVGSNGLDEILDVPSVLDSGALWANSAYTTDGIHPANSGLSVAATYLKGVFANYVGTAPAGYSAVSAEAQAVAAAASALGAPLTAARLGSVDFSIKCMKGFGIWQTRDAVYGFAGSDINVAGINWKNPGTYNIVRAGSPNFLTDRGFMGDGTSAALNTQFVPSTAGGNYSLNSGHVSFFSITVGAAASNSNRIIGNAATTTPRTLANPRAVGDVVNWVINDATFGATNANTATDGHFVLRRTGAAGRDFTRNGALLVGDTQASTALPTTAIQFLADVAVFSNNIRIAFGDIGSLLSSVQMTNYRNVCILPYLRDVGAQ